MSHGKIPCARSLPAIDTASTCCHLLPLLGGHLLFSPTVAVECVAAFPMAVQENLKKNIAGETP